MVTVREHEAIATTVDTPVVDPRKGLLPEISGKQCDAGVPQRATGGASAHHGP
jgi:hypothetical protein